MLRDKLPKSLSVGQALSWEARACQAGNQKCTLRVEKGEVQDQKSSEFQNRSQVATRVWSWWLRTLKPREVEVGAQFCPSSKMAAPGSGQRLALACSATKMEAAILTESLTPVNGRS